ncbi:hypothetical protein [Commensalibacter oyaizuii]|uniref:Uncharacterized protein n=1 Tax=Commensalibacter oyaizuii TaxID=3043873 RepID=A0ABT6PZQ9_9PROT|nr:hypothetical protein [Commensalibacter sp. TBRC 16381]MDI2090338.1 hypothetical protein [Commensalibacter sp. TBRC 16381]
MESILATVILAFFPFLLIALIIRLFFSQHKRKIILAISMIIFGSVIATIGFFLFISNVARVTGGGTHGKDYVFLPYLFVDGIILVLSIPYAFFALFKKKYSVIKLSANSY